MSITSFTKIFADTSEISAIKSLIDVSYIHGFTTNPSLMRKAGVKDYKSFCKELLLVTKDKPVSFEIFADDFNEMEAQANEIAAWGKSIYVKIPITNTKAESSAPLIKKLSAAGIKLNVTALLTLKQVEDTCNALQGGAPAIVSVFAGRIADTGRDPVPLMKSSLELCQKPGLKAELLWASTREVLNVFQADQMRCPIITVTPDILKKLSMFNKDLTELSLDTVKMFKTDADAAGFQL